MFQLPVYMPPDFSRPEFVSAPVARFAPAPADGILPDDFHATSNYPEYVHLADGRWVLPKNGRMDGVIVLKGDLIEVIEPRSIQKSDPVAIGRSENGEEGIYLHNDGFTSHADPVGKFSFRSHGTRESPFSRCYDTLYEVLQHDREHGFIVWVLGPAVVFDRDSRDAMAFIIREGYCHALLAGNALAVHDLEAARFRTGLGQDIYTQELQPGGHCNHLDTINLVRRCGSISAAIRDLKISDGVMAACDGSNIPCVLAGSIRDDGPLPGVISDVYQAQDAMRIHARQATTVIGLATQLHTIAFGNMLPGYQSGRDGTLRPVYFYVVDMSEFSVNKLANRGSMQAIPVLTNVQDFMVNLHHNLPQKGATG